MRRNVEPTDINEAIRILSVAKKSMKEQKNLSESSKANKNQFNFYLSRGEEIGLNIKCLADN